MTTKKALTLEDILPTTPTFELNGKSYTLRIPDIADQVWIREKYGSQEAFINILNEDIQKCNWLAICQFAYHQLPNEARADFRATEATVVNDEGEEANIKLSGPEVLLHSLKGHQDAAALLIAITQAIVKSNPIIEEAFSAEVKKNLKAPLIGGKYLTPSKANTGGRKKK